MQKIKIDIKRSEYETNVIMDSDHTCDEVRKEHNYVGYGKNDFQASRTEKWIHCVNCRFWVHYYAWLLKF